MIESPRFIALGILLLKWVAEGFTGGPMGMPVQTSPVALYDTKSVLDFLPKSTKTKGSAVTSASTMPKSTKTKGSAVTSASTMPKTTKTKGSAVTSGSTMPKKEDLEQIDPTTLGAGLLGAFALATFSMRQNVDQREGGSSRGGSGDVSIPYDAAARLAYDEWQTSNGQKGVYDEEGYQAFKTLYEEKCVAEVTAKKKTRDLASLSK